MRTAIVAGLGYMLIGIVWLVRVTSGALLRRAKKVSLSALVLSKYDPKAHVPAN